MARYKRYEREYYAPRPRPRRSFWRGCLNALIVIASAIVVLIIIYAVVTYRQYIPATVNVVLLIVGGLLAIAVIGAVIWLISAIWSFVSDRMTQVRLNSLEVHEKRAKIEQRYPRAEIDAPRVAQSFAKTGQIAQARAPLELPRTPREYPPALGEREQGQAGAGVGYQNRKLEKIYYSDVYPQVEPGHILIGIKQDKSIRSGTWDDNKTTLILGNSSSGKTTTAIEKCASAILSGALLVPCDPHAHKEDSLSRRLYPLKDFLWPGARFAVTHEEVLANVQLVLDELNRRVQGASTKIKLVLVVDEYNRLMRDETIAKKLAAVVETIGQEGRGYGVYGVFICQRISGNAQLRKSVNSYIVHRVDEAESKLILPGRYAKYAPELNTGLAIVKDADGAIEYLQQTIVTPEFIADIVAAYGEQVLALKARLRGISPERPARVTKDLRRVDRPTVKLNGSREPQPRPQPRPQPQAPREPGNNLGVWGGYREPQPQLRPQPQPVTARAEPLAGDELDDNIRVDLDISDFGAPRQAPAQVYQGAPRQAPAPAPRPARVFHPTARPAQAYQGAPAPAPAFLPPRVAGVPGYYEPAQGERAAPAPGPDLDFPPAQDYEAPASAQGDNIPIPDDIKRLALQMARDGQSRRKIREATGLVGVKYELLRRLLDAHGL